MSTNDDNNIFYKCVSYSRVRPLNDVSVKKNFHIDFTNSWEINIQRC